MSDSEQTPEIRPRERPKTAHRVRTKPVLSPEFAQQSKVSSPPPRDAVSEEKELDEYTEEDIGFRALLRETVLGYLFWSLFQGIGPMIWFFPLNELEISGYEVFVVTMLSPVFTAIPGVLPLIQSRWGLAVLRLCMLACVGCFQAPSTLSRLIVLSAGCFFMMLVFTATLWSRSAYQRSLSFWGLMLGLSALLTSRVWFVSFIPTWWSNISNNVVIAVGAVATFDKILSGDDVMPPSSAKVKVLRPNWFITGVAMGSLMYLTHWILGEASLITRWTVRGFPNTGPMPYPWGALVLFVVYFGVMTSPCSVMTSSIVWWLTGAAGFAALYYLQTWQGYAGGLVIGMYTMSVWPEMMDRFTACPPARTICVAVLFYVIEILFFVWTVAYNFVPGGVYTREHTDWLIGFMVITIGLGLLLYRRKSENKSNTSFINTSEGKMPNSITKALFLLLLLVGVAGFAFRYNPNRHNQPLKKQPKADFSAAIWTYHFGYDNRGWPSLERSAQALKDTGADVITLLESDASKPFLGNNDLGMWLGEKLDMYVDFGVATKDHTWGNLLLSKYPIVKSTPHLLPSPHGELAPGITATINFTGHLVDFVVTHMGNDRDNLDRELQAKFLAKELREAENPVVFLGYVTSSPFSRDYRVLTKKGNVKDIDSTDDDRWCEYIMYRGLKKLGYARITHGGLTDTEIQMARFRIPEDPKNYKDNTKVETDPDVVDKEVHFNPRFGEYYEGHGNFIDHKFHMSTPKYFV